MRPPCSPFIVVFVQDGATLRHAFSEENVSIEWSFPLAFSQRSDRRIEVHSHAEKFRILIPQMQFVLKFQISSCGREILLVVHKSSVPWLNPHWMRSISGDKIWISGCLSTHNARLLDYFLWIILCFSYDCYTKLFIFVKLLYYIKVIKNRLI